MDSVSRARQTQLVNIQDKTGKTLDQVRSLITESGLSKHTEIRKMLSEKLSLGFGDADMLVHFALNSDGQSAAEAAELSPEEILMELYNGPKQILLPIHEKLIAEIIKFGDFTTNPKKGYVSLRRKRQFAMVGPGTKGRLEIGLNLKGITGTARLIPQTNNLMCQFKVYLCSVEEIDTELIGWLNLAYQASA